MRAAVRQLPITPSIFASLLDREKGGAFGFEVAGDYRIKQSYVPHTNILSTQFSSDEGKFVVLDYMPCYRSKDETGHYLPAEMRAAVRQLPITP